MKRPNPISTRDRKRGRPAKFGRPSRMVNVTLPLDVIETLQERHPDIGWAIVETVRAQQRPERSRRAPGEAHRVAELVRLPNQRALILVRESVLRHLPGQAQMISLADGRAMIEFPGESGLADLELAILDRIAALPAGSVEQVALQQFRETLGSWRRDRKLRFTSKSIVVVEGLAERSAGDIGFIFPDRENHRMAVEVRSSP